MGQIKRPWRKGIAAALALLLLMGCTRGAGEAEQPPASAEPPAPANAVAEPEPEPEPEPADDPPAEEPDRTGQPTIPAANPQLAETGRDRSYPEVDAVAAQVGSDPAQLLAHLSVHVGYEPYPGVLRGPLGTLRAGAGNAADQALLLHHLLRTARPEAQLRYAFATLPPEEVDQLLATVSGQPAVAPPAADDQKTAPPAGDDQETAEAAESMLDYLSEMWDLMKGAVKTDLDFLTATVGQLGAPPAPEAGGTERLAAAAPHHVWLQIKEGDQWIDLDPTLPNAAPGQRRAEPERTAPDLPAELYHHVAVNVRMEEPDPSGMLQTRNVLATAWRAADLVGSSIAYGHAELLGLTELAGQPAPQGTVSYTPVLLVDGEAITGEPFAIPLISSRTQQASMGDVVGGLFGAAGGALGGGDPNADLIGPTGLWLEWVFTSPDGAVEQYQRAIFDRIGYATRQSPPSGGFTPADLEEAGDYHLPLAGLWSMAVWTGEPMGSAAPDPEQGWELSEEQQNELVPFLADLGQAHQAYYGLKRNLLAELTSPAGPRFIPLGPNLSLLMLTLPPEEEAGPVLTMDLIRSEVAALPGGLPPNGLVPGVAALYTEKYFLRSLEALGILGPEEEGPDVAKVFARARADQMAFYLLGPTQSDQAESIAGSPEAQARIRARLSAGHHLLLPAQAVPVFGQPTLGWWVYNPHTGQWLDELENGRHQGMSEYGGQNKDTPKKVATTKQFGKRMGNVVRAMTCAMKMVEAYVTYQGNDVMEAAQDARQGIQCVLRRGPAPKEGPKKPRRDPGGQRPFP